jgi:hypothetical protein
MKQNETSLSKEEFLQKLQEAIIYIEKLDPEEGLVCYVGGDNNLVLTDSFIFIGNNSIIMNNYMA